MAHDLYTQALQATPGDQVTMQAALTHDLAILSEKTGAVDTALSQAKQSVELFGKAQNFETQLSAFNTLAGMQKRAGELDASKATIASATDLSQKQHLFLVEPIATRSAGANESLLARQAISSVVRQPIAELLIDRAASTIATPPTSTTVSAGTVPIAAEAAPVASQLIQADASI